jgi:transcriptional regulator with XRE-family HTH domain
MSSEIGFRIKEIRVKNNFQQTKFAEILGIEQSNLSHIENKGKRITLDVVMKVVSNFNIDANWLLKGTIGEFHPNSSKIDEECKICIEKERVIVEQKDNLATKDKFIARLEGEINEIKKYSGIIPAKIAGVASAG